MFRVYFAGHTIQFNNFYNLFTGHDGKWANRLHQTETPPVENHCVSVINNLIFDFSSSQQWCNV